MLYFCICPPPEEPSGGGQKLLRGGQKIAQFFFILPPPEVFSLAAPDCTVPTVLYRTVNKTKINKIS